MIINRLFRFKIRRLTKKVLFTCLIIFIIFSLPGSAIEVISERSLLLKIIFSETLAHFIAYGWLAFTVWWDYGRGKESLLSGRNIFIYCFAYSLFIEIFQGILPWRSFEFKDLFANGAGIFLSLGMTHLIANLRIFRKNILLP